MPTHRVIFIDPTGDEWRVDVADGTSLLEAARRVEAPVHTLCNGVGACVQCRVRVRTGAELLSAPEALEKDRVGNIFHITGERMGCQARVHGDVVIETIPLRLPKRSKSARPPPPRR